MFTRRRAIFTCILVLLLSGTLACAETGEEAWLRYFHLTGQELKAYTAFPASLVVLGDSILLKSAQQELSRGIEAILGKKISFSSDSYSSSASLVLGTAESIRSAIPGLQIPPLDADGYWLFTNKVGDQT